MLTASRKAKGRNLQNDVVELLRYYFNLDNNENSNYEGCVRCVPMGQGGQDIIITGESVKKMIPLSIECKAQERLNIWDAIKQAERNSKGSIPTVVFKKNRSRIYCVLPFADLVKLMRDRK